MYFEYNTASLNDCTDGIYSDFCSGTRYKECPIFENNPYALQLQILMDDFGLCKPLGSKANAHKTRGIYLQIRNMPVEYLSRIEKIYLVALCNVNDFKNEYCSFDDVLKLIVEEISIIEKVGIKIDESTTITGTLINVVCDNLGANQCFGFSESFNCEYYCRMCTLTKEQCKDSLQRSSREIKKKN